MGVIEEYKTVKSSSDVNKCLDRKEHFNMLDGEDFSSKQPWCWKKGFEMGGIIPKKHNCGDCEEKLFCVKCDELIFQTKKLQLIWMIWRDFIKVEKDICYLGMKTIFEY